MSKQEFNWDAFNKSLQSSTNICSGARADIERAIKAGKGQEQPKATWGQLWKDETGSIYMIQSTQQPDIYIMAYLARGYAGCHAGENKTLHELQDKINCEGHQFLANTPAAYFDAGGKL